MKKLFNQLFRWKSHVVTQPIDPAFKYHHYRYLMTPMH